MWLAKTIFGINVFIIWFAMIGYPLFIKGLSKIYLKKDLVKIRDFYPTVTVMVVAHNEEKVIKNKLENLFELDYPHSKLELLIASDNSTDNTNYIVKNIIQEHREYNIQLYEVNERKGKTNAQDEAQKCVHSEILVMTDANTMFKADAIKELVSAFSDESIAYVTGKLEYINSDLNDTAHSESVYWDSDLFLREIESKIQTITAGNGAIYACRNKEYHSFNPIYCHDSAMPVFYALQGKRAIANHDAIAYEKAGENTADELKRKIRMNRTILHDILPSLKILNFFKYKWFSVFYFGHRTCRYLLWFSHAAVFITSIYISICTSNYFFKISVLMQILFYFFGILEMNLHFKSKILMLIGYYCITIYAQFCGVINILTGNAKPFWEKAESTR